MTSVPYQALVNEAVRVGAMSPCQKSKRGCVVWYPVRGFAIVGVGYNEPALGLCDGSAECRRDCGKICRHAEQAALADARNHSPYTDKLEMLHIKVVDGQGVAGGPPSCVECSKLIYASGIGAMWLLEEGRGWVRRTGFEFHQETLKNLGLRQGV